MGLLYLSANGLYVLLYYVVSYRKSVVRTNLRNSFPNQDDAWIISTEKAFYRHLCDVMVEVIKSSSMSRAQLLGSIRYENPELLHRHYLNHRSVVVIMAHTGNWEWIPPLAALIAPQFSQGLYKPLSNKAFDEFFKQTRTRFGSGVIPMDRSLKVMMEQQRQGELTATAFIADQTPSNLSSGVWLKFLNQDTLFFTGTEKIARKLGYAVIYMSMKRNGRGKYIVSMTDLCDDASKTEEGYITRYMASLMERDILEQPENWLWSHKRWKHQRANQAPNEALHKA
jgi:KDO2-lipid IV(A) lauroyltransferase